MSFAEDKKRIFHALDGKVDMVGGIGTTKQDGFIVIQVVVAKGQRGTAEVILKEEGIMSPWTIREVNS